MSPLALSLRFLQAQPDGRLTQLAREGHEPAFEALVRRYRNELLAYCRRLTPQAANAEDTLQQALLQAWRALKAGAEVREVKPWLYRIAHNVAISHLRAAAATTPKIEDAVASFDVDQVVQHRLQARAALASMALLPELQRQVFVRTTLDGASHEEVATALGLSSGAVRGLIYRARAALRAAAAAVIPSPVLSWAFRHAETSGRRAPRLVEVAAGGGGAGVAGLVAKGGAVLAVAGAVAGGGMIVALPSPQHRHIGVSQAHSTRAADSGTSASFAPDRPPVRATGNAPVNTSESPSPVREVIAAGGEDGSAQSGTAGPTTSSHDRGSSGGSRASGSDSSLSSGRGADSPSATSAAASDGGRTTSSRDSSGSGASSGSSPEGGRSGSSGSGGGMSGTSGEQVTAAASASRGSSGSDGGSSGTSGDGGTTTPAVP